MSITSGLAPIRNYANGGDINTKRQNMLAKLGFPSGMTNEDLDAAIAEEERISSIASGGNAPKTADDLKQDVKDYVFDYTDPLEYATLPFLAPKLAMKGKKIFDAVRGPGSKTSQNLRGLGAYIGTDILARDVLGYENPFGDDAQDEAQKDLEDVNKKEEEEKEKKEEDKEKELTPKEKGIKALAAFAESFGDSQEYTSTPGYMIEGASISTPEIRRYADGGIANLEPMMMAAGGVPGFKKGISVFVREQMDKLSRKRADKKQKKADKAQEKADKAKAKADEAEAKAKKAEAEVKETGVTKDKPSEDVDSFIPPGIAMFGSKATDLVKQIPTPKRQVGRAVFYGAPAITGLSYGADALFGDDKKKPPTGGSNTAAVPEIEESDALLDIIRQTSLERAQAAGRTEPTFIDYLASFPSSYMEKVERDPEFAKQMMAGFTAMTRTTEGFAPRNALTDFVQGVEAERIRQEDAVPDQLQLIEKLREDPDLLKAFRQINRDAPDPVSDQKLIGSLKETLLSNLYPGGYDEESEIIDKITEKKVTDIELLQRYRDSGGNYTEMLKTLTAKAD